MQSRVKVANQKVDSCVCACVCTRHHLLPGNRLLLPPVAWSVIPSNLLPSAVHVLRNRSKLSAWEGNYVTVYDYDLRFSSSTTEDDHQVKFFFKFLLFFFFFFFRDLTYKCSFIEMPFRHFLLFLFVGSNYWAMKVKFHPQDPFAAPSEKKWWLRKSKASRKMWSSSHQSKQTQLDLLYVNCVVCHISNFN